MSSSDPLLQIRERVEKALQEFWNAAHRCGGAKPRDRDERQNECQVARAAVESEVDSLVAEVDRLRKENERLQALLDDPFVCDEDTHYWPPHAPGDTTKQGAPCLCGERTWKGDPPRWMAERVQQEKKV